jgi:3-hydroxybutyryl-CoA dehydrogenase
VKSLDNVRHILVIGTGMMGPGIALSLARAGFAVTLYGRSAASLARGEANLALNGQRLLQYELALEAEIAAARGRIHLQTDLAVAEEADVIVESIVEQLPVKQEFLERVSRMCPADALLTTNTSGLPISQIAATVKNPERFVGTHYWNPPYLMPLVEVIAGERTAPEAFELACQLIDRSGKRPIRVLKDIPGFLGNRLQIALQREALALAERGVASPEDIDTMIKYSFALRMPPLGVFEYMDMVGLDLAQSVHGYLLADLDNSTTPSRLLTERVDQGLLGAKTGQGFFAWTPERAEERKRKRDDEVARQLRQAKADGS